MHVILLQLLDGFDCRSQLIPIELIIDLHPLVHCNLHLCLLGQFGYGPTHLLRFALGQADSHCHLFAPGLFVLQVLFDVLQPLLCDETRLFGLFAQLKQLVLLLRESSDLLFSLPKFVGQQFALYLLILKHLVPDFSLSQFVEGLLYFDGRIAIDLLQVILQFMDQRLLLLDDLLEVVDLHFNVGLGQLVVLYLLHRGLLELLHLQTAVQVYLLQFSLDLLLVVLVCVDHLLIVLLGLLV